MRSFIFGLILPNRLFMHVHTTLRKIVNISEEEKEGNGRKREREIEGERVKEGERQGVREGEREGGEKVF